MSSHAAPERDPNVLTPDEYSMLDGADVSADVSPVFTRVTVRRKLELRGTTLVLANSVIKQLCGTILLNEAAQQAQSGGGVVPATALPPAPHSGPRS